MRGSDDGMPLNGILAAVYYLSQEAERGGRHDIQAVLRSTIVAIDRLAAGDGQEEVTDPGTCAVLEFFDRFVKASPDARSEFVQLIAGRDARCG